MGDGGSLARLYTCSLSNRLRLFCWFTVLGSFGHMTVFSDLQKKKTFTEQTTVSEFACQITAPSEVKSSTIVTKSLVIVKKSLAIVSVNEKFVTIFKSFQN